MLRSGLTTWACVAPRSPLPSQDSGQQSQASQPTRSAFQKALRPPPREPRGRDRGRLTAHREVTWGRRKVFGPNCVPPARPQILRERCLLRPPG